MFQKWCWNFQTFNVEGVNLSEIKPVQVRGKLLLSDANKLSQWHTTIVTGFGESPATPVRRVFKRLFKNYRICYELV